MMKKGSFLAATILCLTGSAFAADLPTTKSAPVPAYAPPPVYNWTGFYVGVNAGVGFWDTGNVTIFDPELGPQTRRVDSNTAFVGGGQAGYNDQIGQTVFGVEADIQGVSGGTSFNWGKYTFFGPSNGGNPGYLGTVRGRLGYAIDRTLIYATGGFAYGELFNGPFTNNTGTGYTAGGGVEYAFSNNWTGRIEGLFVNLDNGSRTRTLVNAGVAYPITSTGGNDGGLVRLGLNYKF